MTGGRAGGTAVPDGDSATGISRIDIGLDALGFGDFAIRAEAINDLTDRIAKAPVDTQAALSPFVPTADRYQQRVIAARENTIRVVAPAGSGKTQTVVNRVLARVREGVNPARILVLTFDNSAAMSLRTKLREQLQRLGASVDGLTISTLNAFGYWLLREFAPAEHRPVVERDRRRRILWEVKRGLRDRSAEHYASLPGHIDDRYYLDFFSLLKNELFDPRQPPSQAFADFMLRARQAEPFFDNPADVSSVTRAIQAVGWLFMGYERILQRESLIDFDDQKLRPYVILSELSPLRTAIQARFDEIVVDEFQDINVLDFEFIKLLAARATLVVTGDDDQAIYGFRGCKPDFIINLGERLGRDVTSYELQTNYRCPPNIVDHADKLIRHNQFRIPKTPVAASGTSGQITVVSSISAGLEAKALVAFIRRVHQLNPELSYRDIAVLYRTNAQSLPLQIEFILNQIPYYVRDEDNILENRALERLLAVLRAKQALAAGGQPRTADSITLVEAYFRFITVGEQERVRQLFERGGGLLQTLTSNDLLEALPRANNSRLVQSVREVLSAATLLDTFDVLSRRFHGLRSMVSSLEDALDGDAPLAEIYEVAANFGGTIPEFITMMESALQQARATGAGHDADAGVALLTYFRSKGLQWHTVILTTCNDGVIPHRRAQLEDERRLFYVALTRASSNLLISYVHNACRASVTPSRFLREAGLIEQ